MEQRSVLEALMGGGAICRSRDLVQAGVATATIQRALNVGWLEKVSRGTYRRGAAYEQGGELAEVMARVPAGVICLHSAAALHSLGDAVPHRIWVAVRHDRKPPLVDWPHVRWVRWRRTSAFQAGVTEQMICSVKVRLTGPARTVVDMLDTRLNADRDLGLSILRDYLAQGRPIAELRQIAHEMSRTRQMSRLLATAEILAGLA
jgi:predicted transcriptional regulator of viral defense system